MECHKDGRITLAMALNTDFVIPKKPNNPEDINYLNNTEPQSVLNQSEYNPSNQHIHSTQHNPPDQQHCNGIKRPASHKETPKNQESGTKYRDSFGDLHDPSLPDELRKLMQPLFCKLCSSSLNSNLNARMHYTSKNHSRKIKRWLTEHALVTGEPLHKRALVVESQKQIDVDPNHFYCEVCDLPLTGRVHAGQHYSGKSHQKALAGKRAPSGKGHYNDNGKWIRTIAAKSDPTGRDGFGQGFILAPPDASASIPPNFDDTGSIYSKLRCDLCNIAVTSIQQLEVHLVGQKHTKKLKQTQTAAANTLRIQQDTLTQPPDPTVDFEPGSDYVLLSDTYLARFRTPSGQYYCKTCDLSLNSESQFSMHVQSKKHLKKICIVPNK